MPGTLKLADFSSPLSSLLKSEFTNVILLSLKSSAGSAIDALTVFCALLNPSSFKEICPIISSSVIYLTRISTSAFESLNLASVSCPPELLPVAILILNFPEE